MYAPPLQVRDGLSYFQQGCAAASPLLFTLCNLRYKCDLTTKTFCRRKTFVALNRPVSVSGSRCPEPLLNGGSSARDGSAGAPTVGATEAEPVPGSRGQLAHERGGFFGVKSAAQHRRDVQSCAVVRVNHQEFNFNRRWNWNRTANRIHLILESKLRCA